MNNFTKALKLHKTLSGLSNKQLAQNLNIDQSLVSRLLSGKRDPTKEILIKLPNSVKKGFIDDVIKEIELDKECVNENN